MLEGSFMHEDFCGHKGTINPGDLQVSSSYWHSHNNDYEAKLEKKHIKLCPLVDDSREGDLAF